MDKKIKPYGYVEHMMLFEAACYDPRLQNATRIILGLIIRHTQQDGISRHFSIYTTAKNQGISRQGVQNQVNKLKKFGYIDIYPAEINGHKNKYKLILDRIRDTPATQLGCPSEPATQLGCPPATSKYCPPAIQLGCTKKIEDNKERKKEKNTQRRDAFINEVKEEFQEHGFQEIGNLSEDLTNSQAIACWDHWEGTGEFPKGIFIASFKSWLRTGLRTQKIKKTPDRPKNSNAQQNVQIGTATNPIQDWHKKIEPIVGSDIFKSWMRQCWHDGNGKLCTPTKLSAQRIKDNYQNEIAKVLPNVTIVHQPYKEQPRDNTL